MKNLMFVEANCFLIDKKLNEMGIDQKSTKAKVLFHINEVESVRECVDDEKDENEISKEQCLVTLHSGDSWIIDKTFEFISNLKKKSYNQ